MISFNPDGNIDWPELDRPLISTWLSRAKHADTAQERFVRTMIVLNHYASAWSLRHPLPTRLAGERAELLNLASLPELQAAWSSFCACDLLVKRAIDLPLQNAQGNDVPNGVAGSHEARDLGPKRFLEVIYQLRVDLVHARLQASNFRANAVADFGADAASALAQFLVGETTSAA